MTAVVTPGNLGPDFDLGNQVAGKVNIVQARTSGSGKVQLADAAGLSAGTAGRVVDAAQSRQPSPA